MKIGGRKQHMLKLIEFCKISNNKLPSCRSSASTMRIRKHARVSALSFSEGSISLCARSSVEITRVCELNRSPWDVISFAPQSVHSSPDHEYQVDINDNITRNTAGVESFNVFESVASLIEHCEVEAKEGKEEDEGDRRFSSLANVDKEKRVKKIIGLNRVKELGTDNYICCKKTDGKSWRCRREAKQGHSLCEHHLTQLRSYHYNYTHSRRKSDNKHKATFMPATSRRRNRANKTSSSAANPSDFYYYSGFGPLWGKNRSSGETTKSSSTDKHTDSTDFIVDRDDEEDEEEDDDDDDDDVLKKKVRKPIKARSLKSLM